MRVFTLILSFFAVVGLISSSAIAQSKKDQPKVECKPQQALDIKIAPKQDPIIYDMTKSSPELDAIGSGAYSPYDEAHKTTLLGLTVGRQSLSYEIGFGLQTWDQLDQTCVHVNSITVNMDYKPTVYVTNRFKNGTCEFKEVYDHEMTHVKITQKMLNKYAKKLGNHLKQSLKNNYSFGPFKIQNQEAAQKKLQQKIAAITFKINEQMYKEERKHQNRFDDVEAANTILEACDQKAAGLEHMHDHHHHGHEHNQNDTSEGDILEFDPSEKFDEFDNLEELIRLG
ncbi:MAG: hypothetical protein AAF988_05905 [Pseudomonadota bacterium]